MVQVIQRSPGFGEKLGAGIASGVSDVSNFYQKMKLEESKKKKEDNSSKEMMFNNAQGTLEKLEGLIDKSGIGFVGQLNQTGDAIRNRGEFDAATASLLPMFKAMFPRGFTEKEFKIIRDEYIPKSSDREEKIRGKIKGLKHLVDQMAQGKSFDQARSQDLTAGSSKEEGEEFVSVKSPDGKVKKIPKTKLKAALQAGGEEV